MNLVALSGWIVSSFQFNGRRIESFTWRESPRSDSHSFMSILMPILVALHVIVCLLLVLVVLMQRPRSEGLGSAFGGGITDNVFGSQTTNVLARFTTWMAIAFFAITLLLSIITAKMHGGTTDIQKKLLSSPSPESTGRSVEEKSADATTAMGLVNAVVPKITPTPTPTPMEQAPDSPTTIEQTPVAATPAPTTQAESPATASQAPTPAASTPTEQAPVPEATLATPTPVESASTPTPATPPQN